MDLDIIQPSDSSNLTNQIPLIGQCYDLKLSQSIQSLLSELGSETTQIGDFVEGFYKLIQARVDPPLESIWVYASLAFRSQNRAKDEPLDRISAAKDLFYFISSCSSSCGSSKSIALLAPVVYDVHEVAAQLCGKVNLASKREKKAMREVRSLVEAILGYVSVCCSRGFSEEGESGLVTGLPDLVSIWAGSSVALQSFLPLVSGEVCARLGEEGCKVGCLAGVVIAELFFLKLCLSFRIGISKEDLERELRTWAVGSITGFGNFYFFEALVRMVLEKTLPLSLLSSPEDEILSSKVLYDALILVDYSFLNSERTAHLPTDRVRSLAMARLLVTHEGVVYFRERGERKKSISYMDAFCNSCLASQIIRWITSHIHVEDKISKYHGSSPTALIKWLVNLQGQGVKVFDDSVLKSHAELVHETSVIDLKQPALKLESMKVDDELFYEDKKGEELDAEDGYEDEMANADVTAAFVAAAYSMKSADSGKKRKGGKSAEKKKKIKFLKYETLNNSEAPIGTYPVISYNSTSEVENPLSDNDSDKSEE